MGVADGRGVHTFVKLSLVQHNVFTSVSWYNYVVCFNIWIQHNVIVKSWDCFNRVKVEKFVIVQKWNFDNLRKSVAYNNCSCPCIVNVAVDGVTHFKMHLIDYYN